MNQSIKNMAVSVHTRLLQRAKTEGRVKNTRLKDFLDIWLLAQRRDFQGACLAEAIQATFDRRGPRLPTGLPIALTAQFHNLPERRTQWQAFLRKGRIEGAPERLADVTHVIARFLMPVIEALHDLKPLPGRWSRGGPWQDAGPIG